MKGIVVRAVKPSPLKPTEFLLTGITVPQIVERTDLPILVYHYHNELDSWAEYLDTPKGFKALSGSLEVVPIDERYFYIGNGEAIAVHDHLVPQP